MSKSVGADGPAEHEDATDQGQGEADHQKGKEGKGGEVNQEGFYDFSFFTKVRLPRTAHKRRE